MTSSRPPADSLDSAGPNIWLVIWGFRWHTPQDCVTSCRPSCCCALRVAGSAAANCVKAITNNRPTHTLHFILGLPLGTFASLSPRSFQEKSDVCGNREVDALWHADQIACTTLWNEALGMKRARMSERRRVTQIRLRHP